MPNPDVLRFFPYLDSLIAASNSGAMIWTRANPTTFTWETMTPSPARLSLQLVESRANRFIGGKLVREEKKHFIFQAFDLSSRGSSQLKFSISGAEDDQLNARLHALHDSITFKLTTDGLDFLKSIVPPPK